MKTWFLSYCWTNSSGSIVFENELTQIHPLLRVKKWNSMPYGNNRAKLISYQLVQEEGDVAEYVLDCVTTNGGELL